MVVMPRISVVDEAIIDKPPLVVFNAVLDENKGITHWWMPYLELKTQRRDTNRP
jgi:hypothetical protein